MDTQRIRLLRQNIDAEQRKLENALQTIAAQPCADDNELASLYESTRAGILIMARARERLLHLTRQITAIENRPNSLCTDCGDPIPPRRLAVVPDTMRCAACQEEWEEEQRSPYRNDPRANASLQALEERL